MERYMVNSVEIEYDTFDIDNLTAWEEEVSRVAEETEITLEGESGLEKLRRVCYAMMDLFDRLCGEGTARKIFGERVNVKAIYEGYHAFTSAVSAAALACAASMGAPAASRSRGQRQTAERRR